MGASIVCQAMGHHGEQKQTWSLLLWSLTAYCKEETLIKESYNITNVAIAIKDRYIL